MATPITKKQKELLDFLIVYYQKWGFTPTYREMAKSFDISLASVWERIGHLEDAGRIKVHFQKHRGIEIL